MLPGFDLSDKSDDLTGVAATVVARIALYTV